MGQFGSSSQFGGSTQFGGGVSHGETYYLESKALALPGFWPTDDDSILNLRLRTMCEVLEIDQVSADTLKREIFPHSAAEDLAEWESLLGIVVPDNASLTERRIAAATKYRGAQESTPAVVRQSLYPYLLSEYGWRDPVDDAILHWRYDIRQGAGLVTEASGSMVVTDNSGVTSGATGPYVLIKTNVPTDDITLYVHMISLDGSSGSAVMGLILYADEDTAVLLSFDITDMIWYVRSGGLLYSGGSIAAIPSVPFWVGLQRTASGAFIAHYGSDFDALTTAEFTAATTPFPITAPFPGGLPVRKVGLTVASSAVLENFVEVDEWRILYGTDYNNVNLGERRLVHLEEGGERELFYVTATRYSDDSGSPDFRTAQRQANAMAPAHTALVICQTEVCRCDDPESLCDRDACGV